MKTIMRRAPGLAVFLLSAAMTFGNLPLARAQLFEPDPPPASAQHLSTEDGVKKAIEWAKFGNAPTTDYAVDTAIGVISVGYPPAGAALAIAWGFIKGLGGGSDPVGDALRALSGRLDELNRQVNEIRAEMNRIQDGLLRLTNEVRMRELLFRKDRVEDLTFRLKQMPTDQKVKEEIVNEIKTLARRFLPDAGPDASLYYWSDQKVYTDQSGQLKKDQMLPAEFKLLPTFDYYVATLVLLMNAIEYEVGNNGQLAVKKYGPELLRHAAFLSVRPPWREFADPGTLPEQVMYRNTCYIQPGDKYPINRTCGSYYICDDIMRRTRTTYPGPSYSVASNNQLCTLPSRPRRTISQQQYDKLWAEFQKSPVYGTQAMQSFQQWTDRNRPTPIEDDMENAYGLGAMTELADRLVRLAKYGTTREQYIGNFDMTFWSKQFLYGVRPNGELIWFGHLIGVDKNPPKDANLAGRTASSVTNAGTVTGVLTEGSAQSGAGGATQTGAARVGGATSSVTKQKPSAPTILTQKLNPESLAKLNTQPAPKIIHQWEGPKLVGSGWQSFVQVIPAGQSGFYGLGVDGLLKWYRHDGFLDGTAKWKGPVNAGPGATATTAQKSVALPSPALSEARNTKSSAASAITKGATTTAPSAASSAVSKPGVATSLDPKKVETAAVGSAAAQIIGSGVNWLGFKKIVAGADGVLYAIGTDGALYWYRHQDYVDTQPQPKWSGPFLVGSGWQNFVHVFSTGEGIIYAVQPNGDLIWYRHKGYLTGQNTWDAPKKIGTGWAVFKRVFSPGTGVIYALQTNGALLWYQHDGYQDGTTKWQGPTQIAADWGNFVQVFPRMWGTPQAPIVR